MVGPICLIRDKAFSCGNGSLRDAKVHKNKGTREQGNKGTREQGNKGTREQGENMAVRKCAKQSSDSGQAAFIRPLKLKSRCVPGFAAVASLFLAPVDMAPHSLAGCNAL